ncbi:hypothetical protein [Vibrio penaeicida]|uniref:hypothetical protein n=1 Tax=Vibrio penaeicida TaxID=104609 RepID=UPI000CE9C785|nr:hypothetical protein [Vibrio penaeicida]
MKSFPNMQQPDGSLYCGAYCVVATLYAFDKLPFTAPPSLNRYDIQTKSFSGPKLDIVDSSNLTDLALELYKVTGILTKGTNPEYGHHSESYNSLGAMLYILQECGLKAEVVFQDQAALEAIQKNFPIEFELIETLGSPIEILANDPPSPKASTPKDSVLISVIEHSDLHYVANNDRGEWFDSDMDNHLYHWKPIEEWKSDQEEKREGASWYGVSIRVRE